VSVNRIVVAHARSQLRSRLATTLTARSQVRSRRRQLLARDNPEPGAGLVKRAQRVCPSALTSAESGRRRVRPLTPSPLPLGRAAGSRPPGRSPGPAPARGPAQLRAQRQGGIIIRTKSYCKPWTPNQRFLSFHIQVVIADLWCGVGLAVAAARAAAACNRGR
jgi:hypothetical protein